MIPIGTDRRLNHTPLVNYILIAVNVFVFVYVQKMRSDLPVLRMYLLHPDRPELHQFFTCVFMHGGWAHLIGNMIFLWVFGNAVNDSFGHVGYLAFYLAGGVIAGVGYVLLSGTAPVLGASGAISAVTGAFLVLFPRVRVTVLMILFYVIVPLEVSSLLFLLLQFIWNMYASAFNYGGGVAYVAHSSGYVFGIAVAAVLLAVKMLPRDEYDLLSLIRNWRRKAGYRQAVADGYDPFNPGRSQTRPPQRRGRKWVKVKTVETEPSEGPAAEELQLRKQITADHARGDFATAADGYVRLTQISDDALLAQNQQLDVANYLMSSQRYRQAADAYERFAAHYGNYEYMGDIRLMLGLIYSRYLNQDKRAEEYLAQAVTGLSDENKAKLARSELDEVRRRLG